MCIVCVYIYKYIMIQESYVCAPMACRYGCSNVLSCRENRKDSSKEKSAPAVMIMSTN